MCSYGKPANAADTGNTVIGTLNTLPKRYSWKTSSLDVARGRTYRWRNVRIIARKSRYALNNQYFNLPRQQPLSDHPHTPLLFMRMFQTIRQLIIRVEHNVGDSHPSFSWCPCVVSANLVPSYFPMVCNNDDDDNKKLLIVPCTVTTSAMKMTRRTRTNTVIRRKFVYVCTRTRLENHDRPPDTGDAQQKTTSKRTPTEQ